MALLEEFEKQGNFLFKYRGILPLILVIPALIVKMTTAKLFVNPAFDLICFGVSLFGLCIRIYTIGYSACNTSGRNTTEQIADSINTTGIYSINRHPLYVGNFFMWFGICMLTQNLWFTIAFAMLYWHYYLRIMFAEEQFLRKKFGEPYVSWSCKTPAIIPSFRLFKRSLYSFSVKKVIRQEKTGFMMVAIMFFVFNWSDHWELELLWVGIAVLGVTIYIAIKLIEKTTNLLA